MCDCRTSTTPTLIPLDLLTETSLVMMTSRASQVHLNNPMAPLAFLQQATSRRSNFHSPRRATASLNPAAKARSSTLPRFLTTTRLTLRTSTMAPPTAPGTLFLNLSSSTPLCSKALLVRSLRHRQRRSRHPTRCHLSRRTARVCMDSNTPPALTEMSTTSTPTVKA